MVYSIAVLDQSDFESMGRQMPEGTGVDASLAGDGSTATRKWKKCGKYKKHNNNNKINNNNIASVIKTIGNSESRLKALQILFEFGGAEEKIWAFAEVRSLAYQTPATTSTWSEAASDTAAETEAAVNDADKEKSCTGAHDSVGSLWCVGWFFFKGCWPHSSMHEDY
jgi:hypothetical protein